MEGEGTPAGKKRFALFPDEGGSSKLWRQSSGGGDGPSGGSDVDLTLSLTVGNKSLLGAPVKACGGDVLAIEFDSAEFTKVVDGDEPVQSQEADHPSPADIFVPGAASYVRLPWQCILKQIVKRLPFRVHGFGYMATPRNGMEAWIRLEIPVRSGTPKTKLETFVGSPGYCRYDAMENVCRSTMEYLRRCCDVIVVDANYKDMQAAQERVKMVEDYASMFMDMVTDRDKRESTMHTRYVNVLDALKTLCKEYSDVILVETIAVDWCSTKGTDLKMIYAGPKPPLSRIDEFAAVLVSLIRKGSDLVVEGGKAV